MNRQPKPNDRQPKPGVTAVSPTVAQTRRSELWQGVTYQQRKRRNGRCYWYAVWHDGETGKTKNAYIGRDFRELRSDEF